MGKSAAATNIAEYAAVEAGVPVALFSLEMSETELAHRFLASQARVSSDDLRKGRVRAEKWPKVLQAVEKLARAPIFVDDSSDMSVLELRAKSRRLAARHGLGLVVVDYLQLMRPEGRPDSSRVEQIGQISRGLKILARELDVPVIAVSQLSRAVESRNPPVPMLSDLRESGCLTGDSRVYLPESGEYKPMVELVGSSGFEVVAVNTETWKLERRTVTRAFATGRKSVYRLTTQLGRTIRATGNHKFLGFGGWKRLDEVAPGEHLAVPRALPGARIGNTRGRARQHVRVTGAAEVSRFREKVGCLGMDREAPGERVHLAPAGVAAAVTTGELRSGLGNAYCETAPYKSELSRAPAARAAELVDCHELAELGAGEVHWDRVVSIEPEGVEEVYDLTVEGLHNFVAEDIVVHNSIEQDADVVMFIYRDEYYNKESERLGEADVLVAKHRNGPIGEVTLTFLPKYPRFANLYRERAAEPMPPGDDAI
jgi:replicative DNA helicase